MRSLVFSLHTTLLLIGALVGAASPAAGKGKKHDAAPPAVELICPAAPSAKGATLSPEKKRQATLRKKLTAIAKGGDINAVDKNGQTALMYAASLNNRLAVCWLIAKGADVSLRTAKDMSAADCASEVHIRTLIQACQDEKKPLSDDDPNSNWIRKAGKEELRKSFCDTLSSEMLYAGGASNSGAGCIARPNDIRTISCLLRAGVDTNGISPKGHETLPEFIALMVRAGYDVNSPAQQGQPAVSADMSAPVVRLLLALGLRVPQEPSTEAFWAALLADDTVGMKQLLAQNPEGAKNPEALKRCRSAAMVRLLVAAGADAKKEGLLASAVSQIGGSTADAVKGMLEAGATIPTYPDGSTLLHRLWADDGDMVHVLVKAGVDVNAADTRYRTTALIHAARFDQLNILKALLECGADVHARETFNAKSDKGFTPLHQAVYATHSYGNNVHEKEIVDALLAAGADVNAVLEDGMSVLRLATIRPLSGLPSCAKEDAEEHFQTIMRLLEANVRVPSDAASWRPAAALNTEQQKAIQLKLAEKAAKP